MAYNNFSSEFIDRWNADTDKGISNPYRCKNEDVIRRNPKRDMSQRLHRPPFCRDIDKILNVPPYNRYAGKTQVFSFVRNDDISRRGLHVQLVARTARTIARMLRLNEDLTEAIALGHDLGHTPFGHAGEHILNDLYHADTGRYFNHNVHSARVLDHLYARNVSLQTLDGILCHNGESSQKTFYLGTTHSFDDFDAHMEACYTDESAIGHLRPATLEGCVVRISDMIAYVGKDRQDAMGVGALESDKHFTAGPMGVMNAEIINNLVVNIIENSYGKPYIKLDTVHFEALRASKAENYKLIYNEAAKAAHLSDTVRPMMQEMYVQLLDDLRENHTTSPIFTHHIAYVTRSHYPRVKPYADCDPNQIVVDYIASMTDDYFIDLHHYLFPNSPYKVVYKGYFDGREAPAHV